MDITPVEIDSGDYSPTYSGGEPLWGLGFGIYDYINQKQPQNLLHTELAYVAQKQCIAENKFLGPSTMCAYYDGRDVCSGDSGGPLLDQENGNQVVVGLVSYGEPCDVSKGILNQGINHIIFCEGVAEPTSRLLTGIYLNALRSNVLIYSLLRLTSSLPAQLTAFFDVYIHCNFWI